MADIDFCRTEAREEAEGFLLTIIPNLKLRWLFFENDPHRVRGKRQKHRSAAGLQTSEQTICVDTPNPSIFPKVRTCSPFPETRVGVTSRTENRELRTAFENLRHLAQPDF